jgi:hypothetical protein
MGIGGADYRPHRVVFTLRPQPETGNRFLEFTYNDLRVADWSFLAGHAPVLLCIARDPGVRLRDITARTGVTERTAYGIVTDLAEAGYVVKHEDGRRNRCQIQAHLPLPETDSREPAIGEIPALLAGADDEAAG